VIFLNFELWNLHILIQIKNIVLFLILYAPSFLGTLVEGAEVLVLNFPLPGCCVVIELAVVVPAKQAIFIIDHYNVVCYFNGPCFFGASVVSFVVLAFNLPVPGFCVGFLVLVGSAKYVN
jgi:hypothetical protein